MPFLPRFPPLMIERTAALLLLTILAHTVVLVEHGRDCKWRLDGDEVLVYPRKGLLDSTVVATAVKPWLVIVALVRRACASPTGG